MIVPIKNQIPPIKSQRKNLCHQQGWTNYVKSHSEIRNILHTISLFLKK